MDRTSIDESSLLAETEDLLATLDAAAFAQPRSSSNGSKQPTLRELASNQTSSSPTAAGTLTLSPAPGAPQREPRRLEIQQLRRVASELESQLELLQQRRHSHAFVRDKRTQVWQELAARQQRVRQLAEDENAELKAMIAGVLNGAASDAQQIQRYCNARLNTMQLPNHWHGTHRPPIVPAQSTTTAGVLASLLARLDAQHAQVDAVLHESGVNENLTEPRSFAEKKARRLGEPCQFFQLTDVRLVPFHWQHVGHATWHINREWHTKDDPLVLASIDRPADTFAIAYRVTHKTLGERQSASIKFVMRRYIEADRYVFVLLNECDGEYELAGASMRSIGFLVIRSVRLASDPSDAPLAVIQSCMQLFPSLRDGSDERGRTTTTRSLVSLMTSAFEEDVTHIRQRVDSTLLQMSRAQSYQYEQPEFKDTYVACARIKFAGDDPVH